jgi:hypothetical protein
MIDFNTEPYNDDFDENNKFYRILFRPSFAVQARELTQMQTILQNQIKRHGDHIFKQGAMVIPGQASIDTAINYIKIQPIFAGAVVETYIKNLEGLTVVGQNGLTAQVIKVISAEGPDFATLYVRYTNSANDTTTKTFVDNEIITPQDASLAAFTVQAISSQSSGVGSIASIERGVYYVNGHFVLVDNQTIVLDKYNNVPTYRIGLSVDERLLTPEDPGYEMLLDNAQNSFNFAAPGAHRYYIDLILDKKAISSQDDVNFVELLRVELGEIKRHVINTEYSELEKTMARRTFDESGNYTVKPFSIDVREHRNNNRGQWLTNKVYLIGDVVVNNGITYVAKNSGTSINIPPTHSTSTAFDGPGSTGIQWEYNETPFYNRGVYTPENGGDESKLAVGLEPGKAYVDGYEIEKIATEYVEVNKAREFVQVDNAIIPATVGNYVLVTNVHSLPPVNNFGTVDIYDRITGSAGRGTAVGTKVGTARVRFIELHSGTVGTQTAVYKLGIFDLKMLDDSCSCRKIKSFFFNVSSNAKLSFTADINPITRRLVGSANQSGTAVTGIGTSFQTDLIVGDYVILGTTLSRVTAISTQQSMTVDTSVTQNGVTIDFVSTDVLEPENSSLLYQLPYFAIKSVRGETGTNDTTYTVYERFTGTSSSASGGVCTLTVSTSSGTFASAAQANNYAIVNNDSAVGGTGGTIVQPTNITVNGATVQFTLAGALATTNFIVIGAVNKTGATLTEKSKTLAIQTVEFTTQATATTTVIPLGKADGYRLLSVKMKSGTFASPGASYSIDVTDRFEFDDGQRITHYDVARLILKSSYSPPTSHIQVVFEYFNHSTGDYFTVNSYPNNVAYKSIPLFNNAFLRDFFDFRPRMSDDGVGFSGAGSSVSLVPKRGIDVRTDFQYYLARKTKIAIDFNGQFFAIDGVSSLDPGDPLPPALGMVLYNLTLEPFTFGTESSNVIIETMDNKRYTMRDIGKLEKRIDNLEYYTSLSLLEQQTESLDVLDANGNNRFKNGFIVDSFTGHNTGNVSSPDYLCSIDMENGELRPFFSMQNVNLLEKASSNASRSASNYQLYGDVITLPVVDNIPLIVQEYASRVENINPFAVFTFLGSVSITPESDDWFEVDRRPDLIVEVEGNFNSIKTIAERAGVLGTVWNSWQTQWTGAPTSDRTTFRAGNPTWGQNGLFWSGVITARQGGTEISATDLVSRFGTAGGSGAVRSVTVETTATQIGQQRTGVRTSLVTRIDRQVVGDRVLSTAVIPFIRSRNVLVQVTGLKPSTRFYPFFDDVDVSSFCTPASRLTYIPISGVFDTSTNVGGLAADDARRINGDSQVCLNKGDVITGQTTGATAVVVGREFNPDTNTFVLFVSNIRGTFSPSEQILGSISGARGNFQSVNVGSQGQNIVSNFSGDIFLLFNIPNIDSVRFRTGSREFKLVDVSQAQGEFTSRGRATYRAEGVLETRQQTVNAVRNASLVEEQLRDNRVIVQTSQRVVEDTGWVDPLAQTFLVQQKGGAFLTKVDIFFASKDSKIPVTLEIREVVNGYPGKRVLPFSRVSLKPEDVKLSNNTVMLNGVITPSYDTATSFNFASPVYVQDNTEYCIVLLSDSNTYNVWISQIGDLIPGSSRSISEQPYMGVLFKSQNASTWTADQNQDLKFSIYRAKFDVDAIANVEFVNDVVPFQRLDFDPFETRVGVNKVRVYQRDHGMPVGSRVVISDLNIERLTGFNGTGTISTATNTTTVTGSGTSFTTQLQVGSILYNSAGTFIGRVAVIGSNTSLTLTSNAAVAVTNGAFKYTLPINGIPTTEIYTTHIIGDVDLDSYTITVGTNATATGYSGGTTVRATRNVQYDTVQPIVQIQTFSETLTAFGIKSTTGRSVDSATQTPYIVETSFSEVLANETNTFFSPRMIASEVNENNSMGGNKSVTFNVTMKTDNDALSPILDTQRTSLILVNNKVNTPTETNTNVGGLDENSVLVNNTTIAFTGSTLTSTNATARQILQTIKIGKFINISGTTSGLNNGTFLVTNVVDNGTTATVTISGIFTNQAAGASVTIAQREIFVDEIAPVGSSTYSKYVTKKVNLANPSNFIRIRFAASIPAEASVELYYKTAPVGANLVFDDIPYTKLNPDRAIPFVQNGSNQFIDSSFSSNNLPAFESLQIKIVLKSQNSSAVPRIKDLRVIACA